MKTATNEQCLRLKALGYDGPGIVTMTDHDADQQYLIIVSAKFAHATPAPIIESVFEWARKKKKIHVDIFPMRNPETKKVAWSYELRVNLTGRRVIALTPEFATYAEAQEAALEELITFLKKKAPPATGKSIALSGGTCANILGK